MAQIRVFEASLQGPDAAGRPLVAEEAQLVFHGSGVELGHWTLRVAGVAMAPQLAYARELLALQHCSDTVLTDHVNARPGRRLPQQVWQEPLPPRQPSGLPDPRLIPGVCLLFA